MKQTKKDEVVKRTYNYLNEVARRLKNGENVDVRTVALAHHTTSNKFYRAADAGLFRKVKTSDGVKWVPEKEWVSPYYARKVVNMDREYQRTRYVEREGTVNVSMQKEIPFSSPAPEPQPTVIIRDMTPEEMIVALERNGYRWRLVKECNL